MSGGTFDYIDSRLKSEIFGYGEHFHNALGDSEISHLVWDVLDLLHDYDWYKAGDTCEETWQRSMRDFKKKWFKEPRTNRLQDYFEDSFRRSRAKCLAMIGAIDAKDIPKYADLIGKYGEYVNKTVAADILGVTRATVYNMLEDGRLRAAHQGGRVSMESIFSYMLNRG